MPNRLTQQQRSRKLKAYRKEQSRLAWERDEGICQRCGRAGVDVHHVYGHFATWDETFKMHERYERADRLVVLCRECHMRCHNEVPLIPKDEIVKILERVLREVA